MHAVLQSEDDRTRQAVTVILGKDNSPTPLVEHMRVHHHTDSEEVLRGNKLGLAVCDFTSRLNVAVDTLLGTNASVAQTPHAPGGTPTPMTGTVNPANGAGAGAHAATMARFAATTALFQAPTEQPTPRGKQTSMSDMFQPSAAWTQGEDRHWKEQLVGLIAEQYLSFAIVDSPAFRDVIGTLKSCALEDVEFRNPPNDVKTRWWSTYHGRYLQTCERGQSHKDLYVVLVVNHRSPVVSFLFVSIFPYTGGPSIPTACSVHQSRRIGR